MTAKEIAINKEKIDFVENQIIRAILSSEFLLVINGIPKRYSDDLVYVKTLRSEGREPQIQFFTKPRKQGKTFEDVPVGLYNSVMKDILSGELFGQDFTNWVRDYEADKGFRVKVRANNGMRLLFVETSMYAILRASVSQGAISSGGALFGPTVDEGRRLSFLEVSDLTDAFRVNAFASLLRLDAIKATERIHLTTPKFYRMGHEHFLAMFSEDNVFNPLFDDPEIRSRYMDSKIVKAISERAVYHDKLGVRSTYLSTYQTMQCLGLPEPVPFNFQIFLNVLVSKIMPATALGNRFPHPDRRVFWRALPSEEFPQIMSVEQYQEASDYARGHYVASNTFDVFFLANRDFFASRGFRNIDRVIEILGQATIL